METIFSYLKTRYGYDRADRSFYRTVDEWERWYSGRGTDFHRMRVNNGLTVSEHTLSRMNMAKKVSEDWANLLMNEKVRIDVCDPQAKKFLCGENGTGGVFGENDVRTRMNQLVEKAFALGTGAIVLRLENARVGADGTLLRSPDGKIRTDFVCAQNIVPLSWEADRVTEAAFVGSMTVSGEPITYLQVHRLERGEYVVDSACFSPKTGERIALPGDICKRVRTGSDRPWFALIRPNIVNNLTDLPMGISVFANALDVLKGLDLCYDSFNMEFFLGKKMVFLRKDLMMHDAQGQLLAPQDCNRQLFMYIGDRNVDGDLLPQEFNPALRVDDHVKAIQQQLNYLSCECGLGERHYSFDHHGAPTTATEIISGESALYRSVRKHEILLEQPLIRIVKAMLQIGRDVLGLPLDADTEVSVRFDDSIIEDRSAEQKRDMELVALGLMLRWEFRMKHYGESEEIAKLRCKEANERE